jgi:uncharacterized protein YgfB (UPF0149 family)
LSSPIPALDYDGLRDTLVAAGAVVAPAELHGGVCGALCAGGVPAAKRWLLDALEDEQLAASPTKLAGDLEALIDTSAKILHADDLEFEPLLPDDDAPLADQVEAIAAWCQGFLSGIGSTAPAAIRDSAEGNAIAEILRDFAEISRAGLSDEEAAGQNQPDFALAELHEYVRVSVALVFAELGPLRAPSSDVH